MIGLPVVAVAVFVGGFYTYATHDRVQFLDLPAVADAAEAACGELVAELARPEGDRAAEIVAGNEAIDELRRAVSAVGEDALDDDFPARSWLDDWKALAVARAAFAERIATEPTATFEIPLTDDGHPITNRMASAAGPDCEQAVALAADP